MKTTYFLTEENRKLLIDMGVAVKPWHVVFERRVSGIYSVYSCPYSKRDIFAIPDKFFDKCLTVTFVDEKECTMERSIFLYDGEWSIFLGKNIRSGLVFVGVAKRSSYDSDNQIEAMKIAFNRAVGVIPPIKGVTIPSRVIETIKTSIEETFVGDVSIQEIYDAIYGYYGEKNEKSHT